MRNDRWRVLGLDKFRVKKESFDLRFKVSLPRDLDMQMKHFESSIQGKRLALETELALEILGF